MKALSILKSILLVGILTAFSIWAQGTREIVTNEIDSYTKVQVIEEENSWEKSLRENNVSSYENFLQHYPSGKYAEEAKKRIQTLKEKRSPSFREVRKAKIIVQENYGAKVSFSGEIVSIIGNYLKYAGIEATELGEDFIVKVYVTGTSLRNLYSQGGSLWNPIKGVNVSGRTYSLYSGVSVKGYIVFQSKDEVEFKENFSYLLQPSSTILFSDRIPHQTQEEAPWSGFITAIKTPVLKLIHRVFFSIPVEFLINELNDLNIREIAVVALDDIDPNWRNFDVAKNIIEPLIADLKNTDSNVRKAAASAIGDLKDSRAVESLILALKEDNVEVRAAAAEALGKIDDPRLVEPLINVLKDKNLFVNDTAVEALGKKKDPKVVEGLVNILKNNSDVSLHRFAVKALGKIKDPRVLETLIKELKYKDETNRHEVAIALGELKDPRAVEPLLRALKNSVKDFSGVAVEALDKMDMNWRNSDAALKLVKPLINALKDADWTVRKEAAITLGELRDPRVVDPLINALKDAVWRVRAAAAEALGKIDDPRLVEPLINALMDSDRDVCYAAAEAIDNIDPNWRNSDAAKRLVEPLINSLKNRNAEVTRAAVRALGKIGDSRAVEPLIIVYKDFGDSEVKQATVKALGELKDIRAVELLIFVLKDYSSNSLLRAAAAMALGELKDPRAVEPLIDALGEDESWLREAAIEALKKIIGEDYDYKEEWRNWWEKNWKNLKYREK